MKRKDTKRTRSFYQHDPVSSRAKPSTENTTHLLNIFPEEVWFFVLGHVDNATAYYKICRSSSLFQHLLEKYRTNALLTDVLKVLVRRFESLSKNNSAGQSDEEESDDNDDDATYYRTNYTLQDLVPMRLASRAWKKAVDHTLQNLVVMDDQRIAGESFVTTNFKTVNDITNFETHFESTHLNPNINPFPARRLVIHLPETKEHLKTFYKAILPVLLKYGRHVWHLVIDSSIDDVITKARVFDHLKIMLGLMPNLRVLQAQLDTTGLTEGTFQRLVTGSKYAPFPISPNLSVIEQYNWPLPLFKELIKNAVPNLSTVRIGFGEELADFQEFCNLGLRLTSLKLLVPHLSIECGTLFLALERNFGETLQDLFIWLPAPAPLKIKNGLKLPKLKNLVMRIDHAVPLDFLLDMAGHLEQLKIIIDSYQRMTLKSVRKRENVVKLYSYLGKLHKSNIWTKFPKMKVVKINPWIFDDDDQKICTREQWDAHQIIKGKKKHRLN